MEPTPDSWDQGADSTEKFSGLSISAKPFVPNVHAAAFVPGGGFAQPVVQPQPTIPVNTEVNNTEDSNCLQNGESEPASNWDDNDDEDEEEEIVKENGLVETNGDVMESEEK